MSCLEAIIQWYRLGAETLLFVELKEPFGFRVDYVTVEGKMANPTSALVAERTFLLVTSTWHQPI